MSNWQEFTKGLIKENPSLVMLLGMCPALAITTMASNGLGMGLATTFVLVGSNTIISLLRKFIPSQVRLPAYIIVIAGLVTIVSLLMKAYFPELYDALGIYLALITVNCIIFGRAEAFASKHTVVASVCDGLGMGLGFTLAIVIIGAVREIFGAGTLFGFRVVYFVEPMTLFILPAGGFFALGIVIAVVNLISGKRPPEKMGCEGCAAEGSCHGCAVGGKEGGKA